MKRLSLPFLAVVTTLLFMIVVSATVAASGPNPGDLVELQGTLYGFEAGGGKYEVQRDFHGMLLLGDYRPKGTILTLGTQCFGNWALKVVPVQRFNRWVCRGKIRGVYLNPASIVRVFPRRP